MRRTSKPVGKGTQNLLPKVEKVGVFQCFVLLNEASTLIPFYFFDLHNSKKFSPDQS